MAGSCGQSLFGLGETPDCLPRKLHHLASQKQQRSIPCPTSLPGLGAGCRMLDL